MLEAIFMIIGLATGGIVAWLWASVRARMAVSKELTGLREKIAVAETTSSQLREQLTEHKDIADSLRMELDNERQARAKMETSLQERTKGFEEKQQILENAEKKLKDTFKALSAEALQTSSDQFLKHATTKLDPLTKLLEKYEKQIQELEKNRGEAYGSLRKQVENLTTTNQQLQQETNKLVTSLRNPKVRGRWGEIALRRTAELAGMVEHCDFYEQVTITSDDGSIRPDMIVQLPGGRTVVVDAKAVLDAYLDATAATDEDQRQECLKRHATQIRSRIKELSAKSYWDKLGSTPEFVVLFLPAESFFSAAVEMDRTLIEDAIEKNVIIASPTTLIALLRAIAYGWRQEQLAENADRISRLGKKLFESMHTLFEHFGKVGRGLESAVKAYNDSVGSLEGNVLPKARKFKELVVISGDDPLETKLIESSLRQLDDSRLDSD